MLKSNHRRILFVAVFSLSLVLLGPWWMGSESFGAEKKITVKLAHDSSTVNRTHTFMVFFGKWLEMHGGGRFDVKLYPNAQLGNKRQLLEQCINNTVQLIMTNVGSMSQFYPEVDVLDLPYLFPDRLVVWKIFSADHPDMQKLFGEITKKVGVRLAGFADTGEYRAWINSKREIRKPDDLKGLKFRTIASQSQMMLVKSLGGQAAPVAWPELYTALQTGVVNGTKNSIADIVDMKFHEICKYATIDNHTPTEMLMMMSEKFYQSFPKGGEIQRLLTNAGRYAQEVTRGSLQELTIPQDKIFLESGGKITYLTAEEKQAFVDKAAPVVYGWFKEKHGDYWLNKFQNAVSDAQKELGPRP